MFCKNLLLIFGLIYISNICIAQLQNGKIVTKLKYTRYTNKDGLNAIECNNIVEDANDMYYIATQDGLNILDGSGISKFFTTENGLEIEEIITKKNGFVANVVNDGKLFVYKNRIKKLLTIDTIVPIKKGYDILNYDDDEVLLSCTQKINGVEKTCYKTYNFETNAFTPMQYLNKDLVIVSAKKNNLIGFNNNENILTYFLIVNNILKDSVIITPLSNYFKQNYFVGKDGMLNIVAIENNKIEIKPKFKLNLPPKASFFKYLEKQNFFVYNYLNVVYKISATNTITISNFISSVNNVSIDNHNNLWLCTITGLFNFYKNAVSEIELVGLDNFNCQVDFMAGRGKDVYLASITNGPIFANFKNLTWQKNKLINEDVKKINNNQVGKTRQGFYKSKDGLLFCPIKNILIIYKNKISKQYKLANNDERIVKIIEDSVNKKSYIATFKDVYEVNHNNLNLKHVAYTYNNNTGANSDIVIDAFGNLLVANKTVVAIKNGAVATIKPFSTYNSYYLLPYGLLGTWCAIDDSLFLINKNLEINFVAIIPNSTVVNALIKYKNWVVLATWYDLTFFDTQLYIETQKINLLKFTANDGLQTTKGGLRSLYADEANNTIYWPCNDFLYKIMPEYLLGSYKIYTKPTIKSIYAYSETNVRYELLDSFNTNKIKLRQGFRNLFFDIGYTALANTKKPIIRYKLIGLNNYWLIASKNQLDFLNLKPGMYKLEVQFSINNIDWSDSVFSEALVITPFWYETLIFKILLIALVAFVFYMLYKFRIKQIRKVFAIRQKISQNLHDDIGSTLSSINMYSEVGKKNPNADILSKIQNNTQDVLSKLDDIIWANNPKNDKFINLTDRMDQFARPLLQSKNILFVFNKDANLENIKIAAVVRQNMFLIFKEAINNATKYSNCKTCKVNLIVRSKNLVCTIADDGIGFDTSQHTERNGLINMKWRAKELKGKLDLNSVINAGTTIKISLPF